MTEQPTIREMLQGLFPGAFRVGALALVLGAAALALVLAWAGLFLVTGAGKARAACLVLALVTWGHGSAWLVQGEVRALTTALADLVGAAWLVFLATWWLPVAAAWVLYGVAFGT